jgi:hypothetical protein
MAQLTIPVLRVICKVKGCENSTQPIKELDFEKDAWKREGFRLHREDGIDWAICGEHANSALYIHPMADYLIAS